MRHTIVELTTSVIVIPGTQEIERKVSELVGFGGDIGSVGGGEGSKVQAEWKALQHFSRA